MGKFKEFSINLDGDKDEYFAGEVLSGNVTLHLVEPMQILRLMLFVDGTARCTNGSTTFELIYSKDMTLFGSLPQNNHGNTEHPAGKRTYLFNFSLPNELPSSAKESNGSITYKLTAKVMFKGLKGLISKDWKVKKTLTIKEVIDPNLPEHHIQDVKCLRKNTTLFSKTKKLEKEDLLVSLHRGVYVPGENIEIDVKYKDVCARKMGTAKARLNKYAYFNIKENKNRHSTKKVNKECNDDKRINDKIYKRVVSINIPESCPASNTLTNAVVIRYVVHLKIEGYPEIKLPVIIGTKPYNLAHAQLLQNTYSEQTYEVTSTMPSPSTTPSAPPYLPEHSLHSNFTDLYYPPGYMPENEFDLPPSYEESIQSYVA